jgi:hypothetical protein
MCRPDNCKIVLSTIEESDKKQTDKSVEIDINMFNERGVRFSILGIDKG